jgi:hypothetical protein
MLFARISMHVPEYSFNYLGLFGDHGAGLYLRCRKSDRLIYDPKAWVIFDHPYNTDYERCRRSADSGRVRMPTRMLPELLQPGSRPRYHSQPLK